MEIKDLMIGDWVSLFQGRDESDCYVQIEYINKEDVGIIGCDKYKTTVSPLLFPIPITSEFLLKNGFPLLSERFKDKLYVITSHLVWHDGYIESCNLIKNYDERLPILKCKYVHELQHLLKLCEMDKKFIL
jgi:hypothetical protein